METVANNPEDGQTEILFSHAQVERFRENYICSCLMHFTIKSFISKLREECLKSTSIYSDLICSTLYCMLITITKSEVYHK